MVGTYHTGTNHERDDTLADFSKLPSFESVRILTVQDCKNFDDSALDTVSQMPNLEAFMFDSFFLGKLSSFTALKQSQSLRCVCVTLCKPTEVDTLPPVPHLIVGESRQDGRRNARDRFHEYVKAHRLFTR